MKTKKRATAKNVNGNAPSTNKTIKSKSKGAKGKKKVSIPTHGKKTIEKAAKVDKFKKCRNKSKNYSNWERMHVASANADLELMGLNKGLKNFISTSKGILTPKQHECLKFKTVCEWIKTSKYKDLQYFSTNQIKLICNAVIKANHVETARQIRANNQNKRNAKK